MMCPEPNRSRATLGSRALRRLLRWVVGCGVLVLLVDTWLVEGLLAPVIVASGSMAPALLGPHRQWQCSGCQRTFNCGLESLPSPGAAAICPNCGTENDVEAGQDLRGDRVLIDRSAFYWRAPRRWEPVVFRCPDDARTLCVKRVVGLPGEKLQIRAGELVVDGTIATKDLATCRSMAVLVYDSPAGDPRWQPPQGQPWSPTADGYVHNEKEKERPRRDRPARRPRNTPVDWLVYRHQQRFAGGAQGGLIMDESAYDQDESRTLNPVTDVALRCQIQASGNGAVWLRARSQTDEFLVRVDVETGEGDLDHNGHRTQLIEAGFEPFSRMATVELFVVDQCARLALNGSLLVEFDYQPSTPSAVFSSGETPSRDEPLAIGAQGAQVEVRDLQVWRDVFYTDGPRGTAATQFELAPGEYCLLGDNSPHALDSRGWSPPGLSDAMLVGRVLKW